MSVPQVSVYPRAVESGLADLVLVCVKTQQTESILDDLSAAVGGETVLIALQNGVEADEQLARRFGRNRVVAAAVYVGATVDEPGFVTHQMEADALIGVIVRKAEEASVPSPASAALYALMKAIDSYA